MLMMVPGLSVSLSAGGPWSLVGQVMREGARQVVAPALRAEVDVEARKARLAGQGLRSWAEELLGVAAAEEEDEPLQVAAQFVQTAGGVAGKLCQRGAQAAGIAGQPLAEELQHLGELRRYL